MANVPLPKPPPQSGVCLDERGRVIITTPFGTDAIYVCVSATYFPTMYYIVNKRDSVKSVMDTYKNDVRTCSHTDGLMFKGVVLNPTTSLDFNNIISGSELLYRLLV